MYDEREFSNTEKNDKPVQTTRKPSKNKPKKVNIKSSKTSTSKKF